MSSQEVVGSEDNTVLGVEMLMNQLLEQQLTGCQTVLITTSTESPIPSILELSQLWQRPETVVVVVGGRTGVKDVLLHHSLRNTVRALYLAVPDLSMNTLDHHIKTRFREIIAHDGVSKGVLIYQRCLYCKDGEADVRPTHTRNLVSAIQHSGNVLYEDVQELMGHRLRVVAVSYFPYIDYERHHQVAGTTVTLRDSLDARLIVTFAAKLNFTYVIREEPKRSWGLLKDGVFSGMMGQLQREEADFCTESAPTSERLRVLHYARGYPSDVMTVTSLKPSLLPQHLSFIRPFAGDLWLALFMSVAVWAVILWMLQRAWQRFGGGRGVSFTTAFLYGWGVLLDQPLFSTSVSISGQVLVGWWLVFCLVITTGFRSSLIAHLTVQGTSHPIDTLQDVLEQESWNWGTEAKLYKGAVIEYFTKHEDSSVKQILQRMELLDSEKALQKVMAGSYTLIVFKNYIDVIIASRYTDTRGNTPFYISNKGFSVLANLGWGFRRGAPFYRRFNQMLMQMEAAGITAYWTKDVITKRVKENREGISMDAQGGSAVTSKDEKKEVVLGLEHLQGAFYLLLLGSGLAFLTLLGENLAHSRLKH
ncbi:glutamate receptor-like [Panulirus ornatus]|uniref:glutamate receptor-like n=1 Tax=Panulirus ornatus TaxID=150431 RepID=UPI003A84903C